MNTEYSPAPERPDVMIRLQAPATIKEFMQADVIFGTNGNTSEPFLVYGRELLQKIIDTGKNEWAVIHTFPIPINPDTLELEQLIATVRVAKGHDDYESSDDLRIVEGQTRRSSLDLSVQDEDRVKITGHTSVAVAKRYGK